MAILTVMARAESLDREHSPARRDDDSVTARQDEAGANDLSLVEGLLKENPSTQSDAQWQQNLKGTADADGQVAESLGHADLSP